MSHTRQSETRESGMRSVRQPRRNRSVSRHLHHDHHRREGGDYAVPAYYPDEATKWRSLQPPSLHDENTDSFIGPLSTAYSPYKNHKSISNVSGLAAKPEPRRDKRSKLSDSRTPRYPNKSRNPMHSDAFDKPDQRTTNKLMILCQTPRAVASSMAVLQYAIRLLHIHRPGQRLNFSKSRGVSLDLHQLQNTFSTFRNVTSIGQILSIYTSEQSRIAARRGDRLTRSLDYCQLAAVLYSVIFKALGWVSRRSILSLSNDPSKHTDRLSFIDKSGARVWAGTMVFDFLKIGRELYQERQSKQKQKRRFESGHFDPAKENAIIAARSSPEAIKARRKQLRYALINVAYIPVAIGYSFENTFSWQTIVIATLCAHGLKARGYLMDALRAASALKTR